MIMKYFVTTMTLLALLGVGPVFAENGVSEKNEVRKDSRQATIVLDATQIACVKSVITKREDALAAGHATYSTAVTAAYAARKTALLAAWDKPTTAERRVAVRAADKAFDVAVKAAKKTWSETRRGTWKTFETDRKACLPTTSAPLSATDTGSSKSDSSL